MSQCVSSVVVFGKCDYEVFSALPSSLRTFLVLSLTLFKVNSDPADAPIGIVCFHVVTC